MLEDATALSEHFTVNQVEPGKVRAALGPRIRYARLERLHGLNLEEFGRQIAELLGRKRAFSNVTISNWETGRQEPSFEALVAIAHLTHLPLRYFAGVGEMDDYPMIDWLSVDGDPQATGLSEILRQADSLSEPERALVLAQLKSLIGDVYRLDPERQNNLPKTRARTRASTLR